MMWTMLELQIQWNQKPHHLGICKMIFEYLDTKYAGCGIEQKNNKKKMGRKESLVKIYMLNTFKLDFEI